MFPLWGTSQIPCISACYLTSKQSNIHTRLEAPNVVPPILLFFLELST